MKSISILIPTMNRPDFLVRALRYYAKVGFDGYICIGDSSDTQHVEKTKHAIQLFEKKINIIYRYFPSPPYTNNGMVIKELIELAPTAFAVFSGDDDFLVPRGLGECVEFLNNNVKYSAVHGLRVGISVKPDGVYGRLSSVHYIRQPILESDTAVQRWIGYMRHAISTQYSVHRTETWRRMYRDVSYVPIRYIGPEMLPCSLSAILGKIGQINCLTTVFQVHDDQFVKYASLTMYDLIIHPDWSRSVQMFRHCIVEVLIKHDGIDEKKAHQIFAKEFLNYVSSKLHWQYHHEFGGRYSAQPLKSLKQTIKKYFLILIAVRKLLRELVQTGGKLPQDYKAHFISLRSLLNQSSQFNADFMPIYNSISGHDCEDA